MRRLCSFFILMTLVGCASITPMQTLDKYEVDKNYIGIISACGENVSGNREGEKMQSRAFKFILSNKNDSKQHVIDAINNGSGTLRSGGAEIASKWADRDFLNPLFKAYSEENSSMDSATLMRMTIAYAWKEYSTVLDKKEKKDTALKIADIIQKEDSVEVLYPAVKALTAFAVPETNTSLVSVSTDIFVLRKRKMKSIGGGAAIARLLQIEFINAIKVTGKDILENADGKKN